MSRSFLVSIITGLLVAATATAQDRGKSTDTLPPVQAPPAMDDPGSAQTAPAAAPQSPVDPKVKIVPLANSEVEAKAAAEEAKRAAARPVPVLPPAPEQKFNSPGLPPEVQRAAEATELPVITVRQEGNDTIEEYRKHGKLFAQRIIPKDGGETKWYVDQRYTGPLPPDPAAGVSGHVTPVEYRVFEWK
ncbi:MAG TPA: DUF2782 domain-containing protein [Rudaea sp.]|jgi:hypothetical protein|uniref:DUF2782 domain-containing protein n=1 Tax=Rudaea sp. TaxID=2136325 RepID=UPI002F9272A1